MFTKQPKILLNFSIWRWRTMLVLSLSHIALQDCQLSLHLFQWLLRHRLLVLWCTFTKFKKSHRVPILWIFGLLTQTQIQKSLKLWEISVKSKVPNVAGPIKKLERAWANTLLDLLELLNMLITKEMVLLQNMLSRSLKVKSKRDKPMVLPELSQDLRVRWTLDSSKIQADWLLTKVLLIKLQSFICLK